MKVLIVLEDPTLDQHIAKPVVQAIFRDLQIRALIDVLTDPHLRGIDQALDQGILGGIIRDNPMVDLFLVIADRDCTRQRNEERARARQTEHAGKLLVCLAVEELEVWMLALHRNQVAAGWSDVRADCDPKEAFADPLLQKLGWASEVGRGRKKAMRALNQQFRSLCSLCPEVNELKAAIAATRIADA